MTGNPTGAFAMTRERWAGVAFIAVALAVIALMIFALGSDSSRTLRYTAVFTEGKGLKVGDRVQMSGVDIGEVDHIELNRAGDSVAVRLKIAPDHREKVLANSTAYIADPTLPNVSGQKVVEIHNSATPSAPMRNQAVIEGVNNIFELKAWQLGGQVEQWGKSMVEASEQFQQSARKLGEDARKAVENLTRGVTEGIVNGGGSDGESAAPDDGDAATPPKGSAPAPGSADAPTSPGLAAKPQADAREIAGRLTEFLKELGTKGSKQFGALMEKWEQIQKEIGPMVEDLARDGKDMLSRQLGALMDEIRRQMEELEKRQPGEPAKDAPVAI